MTDIVSPPARPVLSIALIVLAALLFGAAAGGAFVVWKDFRSNTETAAAVNQEVFHNLNEALVQQENALTAPVRVAISSLAQVPIVGRVDAGSISRSFRPVLDAYPQVTALRIGFADGTVTDVSREAMPPLSGDPRPTPWYVAAAATRDTTIETKPYVLSNGQPGISVTRAINGAEGAMAADIELKKFAVPLEKLAHIPEAQMFVFSADGKLLAHPDFTKVVSGEAGAVELALNTLDTLTDPAATAVVAAFRATGPFPARRIFAAERPYLATVTKLEAVAGDPAEAARYVALAIPEPAVAGHFMADGRTEVIIALVVMLLGVPVLLLAAAIRR